MEAGYKTALACKVWSDSQSVIKLTFYRDLSQVERFSKGCIYESLRDLNEYAQ